MRVVARAPALWMVVLVVLLSGISVSGLAIAQGADWSRQFGTTAVDTATSVAADGMGNLYVVGSTRGTFQGQKWAGGQLDAYVQKVDATGQSTWSRQFGSIGDDAAHAVAVDTFGNVLVVGQAAEDVPGGKRRHGPPDEATACPPRAGRHAANHDDPQTQCQAHPHIACIPNGLAVRPEQAS